ncbi:MULTISPECIES: hypothetical protein [Streptomyces]|uniref:Uncharacterized protein n=1 Tax=Streptomyces lycii TaxID=2654337 RepID=A0ABQ7FSZ0_9ACTN|nr:MULTISPECIES: hypothetical protein [Streptomyces]KAF4410933.1 hypothetical protein GCU69_01255 [Streptomyces lycii]PGH48853.1 hypothetical protein CRI70_20865 [Streptomyces sp. Ru87]
MLTIHRVRGLSFTHGEAARPGHDALVVEGDRIEAIAPYEVMLAVYGDRARVREWDGVLTPGRHEPDAPALLEHTYHPDPREAGELGTEPLTGDALTALPMTDTRWGAGARRGLQRLLAGGTTSLAGPFTRPAVRAAVARSGLAVTPVRTPGPRTLVLESRADFAVFAPPTPGAAPDTAPGTAQDTAPGASPGAAPGRCLATVIAGRLVHRAR